MARYAIIVTQTVAALTRHGIAVQLTANTFLIMLAGGPGLRIGAAERGGEIIQKAY
jgi:hypothetical protein